MASTSVPRARRAIVFFTLLVACTPSRASERERAPETDAPSSSEVRHHEATQLTVGIYNVLYELAEARDGVDPSQWADPQTLRHVASLDADILLLQETNRAWEAALRSALSERYPYCAFHEPKRYLPEGLAVCSKFPIERDEALPAVEFFPAQRVVVDAPGGRVQAVNVHLRPAVADPPRWMDAHAATRPIRNREVMAYLAKLERDVPAIVAGDFNESPPLEEGGRGDLFDLLRESGFASALAVAHVTDATWRWAGSEPPLAVQLDHVTYEASAFDVVSASVVHGGRSDHEPVLVTLRMR